MMIQSHVANGNYEILQTVFPYIFEAMFKYENRTVFCQEALTTINYIWNPKNNGTSERIPVIKQMFKELNIGMWKEESEIKRKKNERNKEKERERKKSKENEN